MNEEYKGFSPIKVKNMDLKNMREKGYIGVYPYEIHSVFLMFQVEPTEEQVIEAIERYFNAHAFRSHVRFSRYLKHELVNIKDWDSETHIRENEEVCIKVDFIADEADKEKSIEFLKREKRFDEWVEKTVSKDADAQIHKFATKGSLGFESDEDIV